MHSTPRTCADSQRAALLHLVSLRATARYLVRNNQVNSAFIRMLDIGHANAIETGPLIEAFATDHTPEHINPIEIGSSAF